MSKRRLGYVSNSSSSSFIISTNTKDDRIKVNIEISLDDFMNKFLGDDGNAEYIKTKEELVNYIYEEYFYITDDRRQYEELSKEEQLKILFEVDGDDYKYYDCLKELEKGNVIIKGWVDYTNGEMFETMIKNSDNIKIIQEI